MHRCLPYLLFLAALASCSEKEVDLNESEVDNNLPSEIAEDEQAVVVGVSVTGEERNYTFTVTLKSPDTGCQQYADWWEVVDAEEELAYRRILTHSHVNEQPFSRSGGPVKITSDQEIFVRGHMNNFGYGRLVMSGSVSQGFQRDTVFTSIDLEMMEPLPDGCEF